MTHPLLDLHPSRIVDGRFGQWIPTHLRPVIRTLIIALAWWGVVSGTLSVFSSFQWVIQVGHWLIAHSPLLSPYLLAIGDAVHHVVSVWRSITLPIYEALFSWLPFRLPREALDTLIIASIFASGFMRGWIATSDERKFRAAMSPRLTDIGRVAIVKRILASIQLINDADNDAHREKGWRELDWAVEELKDGVTDKDADYLETIFLMEPDDLREYLMYIANARIIETQIRSRIMLRSSIVGGILITALVIDFIFVRWN